MAKLFFRERTKPRERSRTANSHRKFPQTTTEWSVGRRKGSFLSSGRFGLGISLNFGDRTLLRLGFLNRPPSVSLSTAVRGHSTSFSCPLQGIDFTPSQPFPCRRKPYSQAVHLKTCSSPPTNEHLIGVRTAPVEGRENRGPPGSAWATCPMAFLNSSARSLQTPPALSFPPKGHVGLSVTFWQPSSCGLSRSATASLGRRR